MSFSTILFTEKGKALQAKASAGTPLVITKIKMGSGSLSGQSQITLLDLIEPKVVLNISEIKSSTNFATVKGIFKNSDIATGFYWREIGVFAQDPNLGEILYCYGNAGALAEYIPPSSSEIIEKVVSLSIIVGDATNVSALIDESLVFATKAEFNEVNNKANKILNNSTIYEKAGGTGTAITLESVVLEDGYSKTFIISADNGGAATTINSKPLYKPGTTTAPNLVAGKAYTVWYDLAGDCFFIKASAEGNAVAANVLASKTFSNDNDTGLVGAMINRGAVNQSLAINGTYTIPEGYHDGSGQITQNITTKGAATITPGTTNQTIAAEQYLSGIQTILGDPDLIAANILAGKNIFGVAGSLIQGKKSASGSITNNANLLNFTIMGGTNTLQSAYVTVGGLTFKPNTIILVHDATQYHVYTIYNYNTSLTPSFYPIYASSINKNNATNTSSYPFRADAGNASITNTGFTLPVLYSSVLYYWIAIE